MRQGKHVQHSGHWPPRIGAHVGLAYVDLAAAHARLQASSDSEPDHHGLCNHLPAANCKINFQLFSTADLYKFTTEIPSERFLVYFACCSKIHVSFSGYAHRILSGVLYPCGVQVSHSKGHTAAHPTYMQTYIHTYPTYEQSQ
jgi:hypothetical protein